MDTEKKYRTQEETEIIYHDLAKKWGITEEDVGHFEGDMFDGDSNERPHPVLVSVVSDLKENIDWWIENHQETLPEKRLKNTNPRTVRRKTRQEKEDDIHQELMQEFGFNREQMNTIVEAWDHRFDMVIDLVRGVIHPNRIWSSDYKKGLLGYTVCSGDESIKQLVKKRRTFLMKEVEKIFKIKPDFVNKVVKDVCPSLNNRGISLVYLIDIYNEVVKGIEKEESLISTASYSDDTLKSEIRSRERLLTLLNQFKNEDKTLHVKISQQEKHICCRILSVVFDKEKTGVIWVDIKDLETEDIKRRKTILLDDIQEIGTYNLEPKRIFVNIKDLGLLDFTDIYLSFLFKTPSENNLSYGYCWKNVIEDEPDFLYKKLAEKHQMTLEEIHEAEGDMFREKLNSRETGILSSLSTVKKKIKATDEWINKRKSPYQ